MRRGSRTGEITYISVKVIKSFGNDSTIRLTTLVASLLSALTLASSMSHSLPDNITSDDDDATGDEIARDLATIEASLSIYHSAASGQVVRESVGEQLSRIRDRLNGLVQNAASDSNRQLSERFERASMSHRMRIPLPVLQERQQQQLENNDASHSSNARRSTEETDNDLMMEDKESSNSDTHRSKRSSVLCASRSRAELLLDDPDIRQGLEVALPSIVDDYDVQDEDTSITMTEQQPDPVEADAEEIPFLLNDKSRERLGRSLQGSSLSRSVSQSTGSSSFVYSWGTTVENSLHEDDKPHAIDTAMVSPDARVSKYTIVSVACGPETAAVVTASGEIFVKGRNDSGQVDPSRLEPNIRKPSILESLAMTRVLQVSCGRQHTAALTQSGAVLTWGSNECGQLGQADVSSTHPPQRRHPAAMVLGAARRASSVACGHYFTIVLTTRMSVLVCGPDEILPNDGKIGLPSTLPALEGLPLSRIAAGAHHAVAVTCHGTAFAWGDNSTGCCGRKYPTMVTVPMPIVMPATKKHLPVGKSPFRNWASWDGPSEPMSLSEDVSVVDIACGHGMTAMITKSGLLLVCGDSPDTLETYEHDLGEKFLGVVCGDTHVLLLDSNGDVWQAGKAQKPERVLEGKHVTLIAAGGDQSVAVTRLPLPSTSLKTQDSIESETADGIVLASSVEALLSKVDNERHSQQLIRRTEELFKCPGVINSLFLDPIECDNFYEQLLSVKDNELQQSIVTAIEKGMQSGLDQLRSGEARLIFPETVRGLLLYLQCPLFRSNDYRFDYRGDLIMSLCEAFLGLSFEGYRAVMSWATSLFDRANFKRLLLDSLLFQLERSLADGAGARARSLTVIVALLQWFYKASERNGGPAHVEDFYSDAIEELSPESLYEDLARYKKASKDQKTSNFFFCANSFLMSPSCKRNLLQLENQIDMMRAATTDVTWDSANRQFVFDPYLVFAIDRQYMLQQTLQKVSAASARDLRKSLKVVFKGEDGVDAGGVTKEFFQLLTQQLFDVNSGMWSDRVEDSVAWFNSDCNWNDDGFYLVGVLLGLALYNGVLVDVHFPTAVYRKLLGQPLGLEDMVDELMKSGLQQLLDYSGDDVEDVYCLNFEVASNSLGVENLHELKPNGSNIPVTSKNKEEFVLLYVKWHLVESVKHQYDLFEKGVMQVLDSSSLDLLRPEDLELLVVGSPELDFTALERNTEYEGGYDASSDVVKNFWRFVNNSSPETELQLLRFATGSAKAPIGGLGKLSFKIQRAGPDSMQLPTSHTCFNTLLLPDYGPDYEKLEKLLGRAILECEGFGLQ